MTDRRTFTLDLSKLGADTITWAEFADILDATDSDEARLAAILAGQPTPGAKAGDRARIMAAFAWITLRRDDPTLTYQAVMAGWVETTGEAPSATAQKRAASRARSRMAVSAATGLPPAQADALTLAEVRAAAELRSA